MSKWRKGPPPKDNKTYLVDVGLPWILPCVYNAADDDYAVATVQAEQIGPDEYSYYFENEWYAPEHIKAWTPMPDFYKGK